MLNASERPKPAPGAAGQTRQQSRALVRLLRVGADLVDGARAGRISCVCVPQVPKTGGPALATSNKRDIVDMTRGPRPRVGTVWVHDVQGMILRISRSVTCSKPVGI